jgi:DNA-binding response OmpR family regulator
MVVMGIEDDVLIAWGLSVGLQAEGYVVRTVSDDREALSSLQADSYDLLYWTRCRLKWMA